MSSPMLLFYGCSYRHHLSGDDRRNSHIKGMVRHDPASLARPTHLKHAVKRHDSPRVPPQPRSRKAAMATGAPVELQYTSLELKGSHTGALPRNPRDQALFEKQAFTCMQSVGINNGL